MEWKVPFFDADMGKEELTAVTRILNSGWLTMGEETSAFEQEFAAYLRVKHAFMVSNCTAALHLAHLIHGIGAGDEVICPSLTFVATANSIVYTGAKPVFADITSMDNFNISTEDIKKKINKKTKGITVVHYAGYPCAMNEVLKIARDHGLYIVEDCAHSPGASYKGRMTGTMGDIGCFSFFSNKNLSTGEGGMIVTNNDTIAEKLRLLRSHGMTTLTLDRYKGHSFTYDVLDFGFNYRSSELNAAIGRVQLAKLNIKNQKRKEITFKYIQRLSQEDRISIIFQHLDEDILPAYHLFPVLLEHDINREKVMQCLKDKGVQTSIHYRPIHTFTAYQRYNDTYTLPFIQAIKDRTFTLPLFPFMTETQIDYVVDSLKQSF
jgi:dTDP-4-amino-4,6-dideoxygalactose transaminase